MPLRRLILAILVISASPAAAQAADPGALVAAKRHLQAGVNSGQPAEILAARGDFEALAAGGDPGGTLAYWVALADWRAEPLLLATAREEAKRLCKDGLAACDRALAARQGFADALALKAILQGMSLAFANTMAGMTLGPQMEDEFKRALKLEPSNPRVQLLYGIGTLRKPRFAGGGAHRARPMLEGAVAAFETDAPTDSTSIDWGRDDAQIWVGQCAEADSDWTAAREHYRRALEINPHNGWVSTRLLPVAEQRFAAGKEKP